MPATENQLSETLNVIATQVGKVPGTPADKQRWMQALLGNLMNAVSMPDAGLEIPATRSDPKTKKITKALGRPAKAHHQEDPAHLVYDVSPYKKNSMGSAGVVFGSDANEELYVLLMRKKDKHGKDTQRWLLPAGYVELAPNSDLALSAPVPQGESFSQMKNALSKEYREALQRSWQDAAALMLGSELSTAEQEKRRGNKIIPKIGDPSARQNFERELREEGGIDIANKSDAIVAEVGVGYSYGNSSAGKRDYSVGPLFMGYVGKIDPREPLHPTDTTEVFKAEWVRVKDIHRDVKEGTYNVVAEGQNFPIDDYTAPSLEKGLQKLLELSIQKHSGHWFDSPLNIYNAYGPQPDLDTPLADGTFKTLAGPEGEQVFKHYLKYSKRPEPETKLVRVDSVSDGQHILAL